MRYQVLGPVGAYANGSAVRLGGPKQRLLLALLLVDAGRVVSDDRLLEGMWADAPPGGGRHAVQTYVSELRRLLDDDIQRTGGGYRLAIDAHDVDAHRFGSLVDAARARMHDAPEGAAALLREALELWHGEPYADLAGADALRPEIRRLTELRLAAVQDRIEADLACGQHRQVAAELDATTREHPYREGLRGLHMLALYRSGRQAEALRVYDATREVLVDELGIDPSPALQRLHQRILAQDAGLLPPSVDTGPTAGVAHAKDPTDTDTTRPGFHTVKGFELRERVGDGDFGTVYRAYQAAIGREVAVKVIDRRHADAPAFVRGFEPLAQRVAQLDHPHVVPLFDYWRDPHAAYLVTPWLRGGSLRQAQRHGPWSVTAAQRMLEQVGAALTSAHRHGLVHGDVKASNVLLDSDGNALLTDFPVARRPVDAAGVPQSNDPAAVAPEERRGRPLTPRADVYGLAVLAIVTLTGEHPPADGPADALRRLRPDLPAGLEAVLARATAADPADRHERIEDLLRDLRRALGSDVVALPTQDMAASAPLRNPYKGLRAFQEADAADFFGRDALVERLVAALREQRLVAMVGPSGCGKSSVVRAGLIPALRAGALPGSRTWLVTELFPGSHPFEELEAALLRVAVARPDGMLAELCADDRGLLRVTKQILPADDSELVLVIDQFEELFSLTADADVRRLFLDGLVTLAADGRSRVRTVLTMRADFFDRPLEHHAFGELLRAGLVAVTVPSPEELALAVGGPARAVGVELEPGLISGIVRDVADQPGALPLLQHALTELFTRRDGRLLTAAAYRATGGVLGALGRRAEELYRSLPTDGQRAARQLLLRLVTVDETGEDARRRVRRSELATLDIDAATLDAVIRQLGAHRLLSFDRDPVTRGATVEVAHEALFREWSTLREWIDARREDLLVRRRLGTAIAEWRQAGGSADFLLRGGRLEHLGQWAATTDLALTGDERAYLAASRAAEDRDIAQRRRRRVGIVMALAVAAVVALILAGFALAARDRAVQQERAAVAQERVAQARALAAGSRAQVTTDQDLAVLLALEAVDVLRAADQPVIPAAVEALHHAVLAHRLTGVIDTGAWDVQFVAGGTRIASGGPPDFEPALWDVDSGTRVATLDVGEGEQTPSLGVSGDGNRLAVTRVGGAPDRPDGAVVVFDTESGGRVAEVGIDGVAVEQSALSPDGSLVAVVEYATRFGGLGNASTGVSVWDVASGKRRWRVEPTSRAVGDLAFSPDGARLAIGATDPAVVGIYDAATGERLTVLGDRDDDRGIVEMAWAPSGEQLAALNDIPAEVVVYDVAATQTRYSLPIGADGYDLCWMGDGSAIAALAADDLVHVYDARTGAERLRLPGRSLVELACSADGTSVMGSSEEGLVRRWDVTAAGVSEVMAVGTTSPFAAVFTGDGTKIVSTHHDGVLRLHDAASGELVATADDQGTFEPMFVLASPDGRYVVTNTATPDAAEETGDPLRVDQLAVYDARTLERIRLVDGGEHPVAFDGDSARLLTADPRGWVNVVDVATGRTVRRLEPPMVDGRPPEIEDAGFVADGRLAVVKGADIREAWLLDVATGALRVAFDAAQDGRRVATSRAGDRLALNGREGLVEVFDVGRLLEAEGPPSDISDLARVTQFDIGGWGTLEFSPDGHALAATTLNGTFGVWDARTGERHFRLDGLSFGGASFSPDGRHLAHPYHDDAGDLHAIRVYTNDLDELTSIARRKATRTLSAEECRAYLDADDCSAR